jgi:acyl-coenzyme A thioesterase PaaI-like protein
LGTVGLAAAVAGAVAAEAARRTSARTRRRIGRRLRSPAHGRVPADGNRAIDGYFPGNLGIELVSISEAAISGRLVVDERHLHPGGVPFSTVELKANVTASAAPGDELVGVARTLHRGGRTQVWEVRIEKDGRLAAFFTCTQMILGR